VERPPFDAAPPLVIGRPRRGPRTRLVHEDERVRAGLMLRDGGEGGFQPLDSGLMCAGIHATIIT